MKGLYSLLSFLYTACFCWPQRALAQALKYVSGGLGLLARPTFGELALSVAPGKMLELFREHWSGVQFMRRREYTSMLH